MVYLINSEFMYKRSFMSAEENASSVRYNPEKGLFHSILRQKSVVDEFYHENHKPAYDKLESVSYVDPIIMLFNQERIDNLGSMAAKELLDSLANKSDSIVELRKKCSDEDLLSMIKSRYLQTPSEIMAYCRFIEGNVDSFNSEVKQLLEQQKQQTQIVEPPKTE